MILFKLVLMMALVIANPLGLSQGWVAGLTVAGIVDVLLFIIITVVKDR